MANEARAATRSWSAAGNPAQPPRGPGAAAHLHPLFRLRRTPRTPSTAAFRIPNFLQNLFGEGVLSASFIPVYARLLAEGDEEEAGPRRRRRRRHPGAHYVVAGAAGRAGHAVPDLRHRARVSRRQARAHHPAGAHSLSRRGPAGALGVVPGHSEQPPQVLPLLHRAGGLERGDDRRRWWPSAASACRIAGGDAGLGFGGRAARCSSACSCRWCCAWRAAAVAAWTRARRTCAKWCAISCRSSSAAAWCRSARIVDQLLATLAGPGRRGRRWPTRRRSTCCR